MPVDQGGNATFVCLPPVATSLTPGTYTFMPGPAHEPGTEETGLPSEQAAEEITAHSLAASRTDHHHDRACGRRPGTRQPVVHRLTRTVPRLPLGRGSGLASPFRLGSAKADRRPAGS